MVQYGYTLDNIFYSLSDATRRDILMRVSRTSPNISELAIDYDMSFSAVAKHLRVLEKAGLIVKKKKGKERIIVANPDSMNEALKHLELYKQSVNARFEALDEILEEKTPD